MRGRWQPCLEPACHTRHTRKLVRNIVPETLGFEGSETAGRHGHVNQAFQKIWVRRNGCVKIETGSSQMWYYFGT